MRKPVAFWGWVLWVASAAFRSVEGAAMCSVSNKCSNESRGNRDPIFGGERVIPARLRDRVGM